tara:strand:- start:1006 stop:1362 length:357 start_codon:yes stop_codon:yes gene_type:complete
MNNNIFNHFYKNLYKREFLILVNMTIIDVESIIQDLNNIDFGKDYTKKAFIQIINDTCKKHMKKKKKNTDDKEKKLTAYNQFVKDNMKFIKEKHTDLTPKQHMTKLGELWQEHKKKSQ